MTTWSQVLQYIPGLSTVKDFCEFARSWIHLEKLRNRCYYCHFTSEVKEWSDNIFLPPPGAELWLIFCSLAGPVIQAELECCFMVHSCMDVKHLSCCRRPRRELYFLSEISSSAACRSGRVWGYIELVTLGVPVRGKDHKSAGWAGWLRRDDGWRWPTIPAEKFRAEFAMLVEEDDGYGL